MKSTHTTSSLHQPPASSTSISYRRLSSPKPPLIATKELYWTQSSAFYDRLYKTMQRRKQVKIGLWVTGWASCAALFSILFWSPLVLVPIVNILAFPNLIACAVVLLYALPAFAYLLLAQRDPPSHVHGRLFLPLNPVRNFGIILAACRYLLFIIEVGPPWLLAVGRYVFWEQLLRKIGEHLGDPKAEATMASSSEYPTHQGHGSQGSRKDTRGRGRGKETVIDLFEGFAVFGVPFVAAAGKKSPLLDVYLPQAPLATAVKISTGRSLKSKSSGSMKDIPLSKPLDPKTVAPPSPTSPTSPSSSQTSTPKVTPRKMPRTPTSMPRPKVHSVPSDTSSSALHIPPPLRPVIVFLYDHGGIGPLRCSRQMWVLLGVKFAEMGYVTVIPDITTYPTGRAEAMVTDVRNALHWTQQNIHHHGGDPSKIYIAGHGLGGHLALFTLAQEAVVRSRDDREQARAMAMALAVQSEVDADADELVFGPTPSQQRNSVKVLNDDIPNGLRSLRVYGEDISIPVIAGVILFAPIADIIKQIRHESSLWLEHLSPLRRALGPSQTSCMRNSLGHLLFAAKNVIQPFRLPSRVLIIHGAADKLVPLDSAHWLSELLYGLDVHTTFRPYRVLGHYDILTSLMKGMEGEYSTWLEHDVKTFVK